MAALDVDGEAYAAPVREGRARTMPFGRCQCGSRIVLARTTAGEDVYLDADVDGRPKVLASGRFLEVVTTRPAAGRSALLVHDVGRDGQHRRHADSCSAIRKAAAS